jgi:hypothetical protein
VLRTLILTAAALAGALGLHAQSAQPAPVQTANVGPQVGQAVPAFTGVDQFGRTHTLESSLGPSGAMLVFFRSADW